MDQRRVHAHEQPHVLHQRLQQATVVGGPPPAGTPLVQATQTLFRLPGAPPVGVPHGVTGAKIRIRNILVVNEDDNQDIYFCDSVDYAVDAETLTGADQGEYPVPEKTVISATNLPSGSGYYDAEGTVSVNGRVELHLETFHIHKSGHAMVPTLA